MTPGQQAVLIKTLEAALASAKAVAATTPCSECDHFCADALCGFWRSTVPENARAQGCNQFEEKVPF